MLFNQLPKTSFKWLKELVFIGKSKTSKPSILAGFLFSEFELAQTRTLDSLDKFTGRMTKEKESLEKLSERHMFLLENGEAKQ